MRNGPYHGRISRSQDRSPCTSSQSCRLIAGLTRMRSTSGRLAARCSRVTTCGVQCAGSTAALIRPHHTGQLDCLAVRRGQRALRHNIKADVDFETTLMGNMPAWQRTAAWPRDVLDIDIAQSRRAHLLTQHLDPGNGGRCAPERTAGQVDRLEPRPLRWQAHRARNAAGSLSADDVQRTWGRSIARRRYCQPNPQSDANPPYAEAGIRNDARTP